MEIVPVRAIPLFAAILTATAALPVAEAFCEIVMKSAVDDAFHAQPVDVTGIVAVPSSADTDFVSWSAGMETEQELGDAGPPLHPMTIGVTDATNDATNAARRKRAGF